MRARLSTIQLSLQTESTGCFVEMVRVWPLGCIAALSVRAYRKKTLTPLGVATAIVVSSLYSIHPWGVFLVMLLSFYLTSTFFTKVLFRDSSLSTFLVLIIDFIVFRVV